jgi:small subunit ribosomal protein S4
MAKQPVTKVSRRLGVMLFANSGSKARAFNKKNYKPGEHGQKRFSKMSEYKKQLHEKQKARAMFGISEKKSRRYYQMASKSHGVTGVEYMKLLERRIDNVIFRSGLANTRPQARQMVSHGIIQLNGHKIKTPSILVKEGDKFEVVDKRKGSKLFEEVKTAKVSAPKWIQSDLKNLKGEVKQLPEQDDIEKIINPQLITEFYSK